jgi:hypothetical protein
MKKLLLICAVLVSIQLNGQVAAVESAFELNEIPAIIEGMTFDPVDGNFYFGESVNRRILRYSRAGKSLGYIDGAKDGMTSILGMSVFPKTHHLWVCGAIIRNGKNMMCIFQYDLQNAHLINKYPDTSGKAQLFNDITITNDGSVYTTDTYGRALYKMDTVAHIAELYMENDSLKDPNGITTEENFLYVSTSRGFTKVNTADKKLTKINLKDFLIAGNDGLYFYKNSLIAIQNVFFPVTIARYYLDEKAARIVRAEVLSSNHPAFVIPTTGAIVNDEFYFMANNNIGNEAAPRDSLKRVTVVKITLAE